MIKIAAHKIKSRVFRVCEKSIGADGFCKVHILQHANRELIKTKINGKVI